MTDEPHNTPPPPAPKERWILADTYFARKYTPEEVRLLKTVPWIYLPQALKDKTIAQHDDPESQDIPETALIG